MKFVFEVTAKIESADMQGVGKYHAQGRLTVMHDNQDLQGQPLDMGLVLPKEMWDKIEVGDMLEFPYDSH